MKQTFKISGMSCNGCKSHVHDMIRSIDGVKSVDVNLEKKEATVEMEQPVEWNAFQQVFDQSERYSIHTLHEKIAQSPKRSKQQHPSGTYYCPMYCEGEKTYAQFGHCPVCGMDLVSLQSDETEEKTYKKLVKKFWIASVCTLPIFLIAMSEMIPNNPLYTWMSISYWNWVQLLLSVPVVFYAAWMFFERAYASIVTKNLNMFTLIGIGAGVAWIFSLTGMLFPAIFPDSFKTGDGVVYVYFEAATVILTLVLLGQLLEARVHSKTNSAVKALLELAPDNATRIENGVDVAISVKDIQVGDVLRVKPGDRIPVDGFLVEGRGIVDESMITGEPMPVEKNKGDMVRSGTINGTTSFVMKADKVGADTLLSQIIHMVNEAGRSKAPIQKIADRISQYFVPVVIGVSVVTFFIWYAFGPSPAFIYAFVNAISVLIIACPCALGLATPMSVIVGVGKGAQMGILIKDAESIEKMNQIDVLIMDKTGTITEGKPSVEKVVFSDDVFESEWLQYACTVASNSEHPLSGAIVQYAKEKRIAPLETKDFESMTGKGIKGVVNNKTVFIGNKALMRDFDISMDDALLAKAKQSQTLGKTVSFIALDRVLVGVVVIHDAIKPTSEKAVSGIRKLGIQTILMTGDHLDAAKAVSDQLNIDQFEANCLPEDKLNKVKALQSQGKKVAVVGDGVNDAPALALADIGIAIGTGTDVAIESASVTLIHGDLNGIVKARTLSSKIMKNIKQNLFFAFVYNTVGIPVAAGILYPFFGVLLSPMIAALAMSFSSVSVIANALRLKHQTID